ncbi:fructose-specific PTS transporter subunit EIIC [Mycoplasmopsis felis]|uniref:PTS fructose transporter subunit IIABC n=1 Tax=Mycoplasmopsis felis TaxID=33923 RepID=UPI002AFDCA7F|nr:fructose-specific PTS transporter subunit EIIC [Mycoplasmopsis felis]WQQ06325.1 fructose-specific PTS transporter subunit EIIC [Mycoplasmopsis felis]
MKISSLFSENTFYLKKDFASKKDALNFFCQDLHLNKYVSDSQKANTLFWERENQSSTGIGSQIAMPHIGDDIVLKNTLFFARVNNLDWNSLDGQNVKYIFGIVLSKTDRGTSHMKIMQNLSTLLINNEFINELDKVSNYNEFITLINKYEKQLISNEVNSAKENSYDVVAVTACPTGIAHTFMAKDKLYQEAQDMGISIKVETQGAEGIENKLTEQEIKNAKGVILAVDREIEKSRFANAENVLEISTQKAIHNPGEQIRKVLNKEGTKLQVSSSSEKTNEDSQMSFNGFGKKMYRSLMSGISHMLPFIIFGGILIALGFIIDMIIGASNGVDLNNSYFLSNFGFNFGASKIIFNIGKIALDLAVPVLSAYIAFSLIGRQGLLPGFVVGGIASGQLSDTYGFLSKTIESSGISNPEKFLGTGSGFIGGILGAFFAAAMVIVFSKYIFGKLPKTLSGVKNILFIPVLGTITIAITFWFVNIALIFINLGLVLFLQLFEGKPYLAWLLGLILGLMMASDLGGPINKAAYIFGTLTIANGASTVSMAAVMISGMVPPLGISVSMFISRKLWSKEERESGKISNILFGLSFISEGAIPYTSKNPKVLIPANLVGGAVAGLVSAVLGVNIVAPHGGIFVIFLARTTLFADLGTSIGLGILFFITALLVGACAQAGTIYLITFLNKKYPNLFQFKKRRKLRS